MSRMLLMIAIAAAAPQLWAQDVRVQVTTQEPPYYVGEPVVLQFTVDGLDEQTEPTCTMESASGQPVPGLRGRMGGANPSVFAQVIQRNGQLFRSKRITYQIRYLVTADRAGDYKVGPFLIKQGQKETRVKAVPMSFQDVPVDPNMTVRLTLPETPIYPGQRVPVGIEWSYADDLDNVLKLSIYSPLFDEFQFGPDKEPSRRAAQLPIETKDGRVALAATAKEEQRNGRRFVVVSASRTLIPDRVGQFPLAPITATVRQATQWARSRSPFDDPDDFGFGGSVFRDLMQSRRQPARTALVRAVGKPRTLLVRPFPTQGRPESFAGAVGKGFSIDVAADRTVVRVGDPITLNITLRGDGNLENASLPALSADGGMDPKLFRLPKGDAPGALADGAKQFRASVRVADESVAEIPSLAFSWFEPTAQKYQTARSKPIALRVMPAQIVSASDVVSRQSPQAKPKGDAAAKQPGRAVAMAPSRRPAFSLSGADLAIEPTAGVVLRDHSGSVWNKTLTRVAIYAVGMLFILVAWIDRKRRSVDPAVTARRRTIRRQQAKIAHAAGLPRNKAAEDIAAALRVLVAEFPDIARDEAQAIVAECESIVYAPENAVDSRLDGSLVERAKRVAEV